MFLSLVVCQIRLAVYHDAILIALTSYSNFLRGTQSFANHCFNASDTTSVQAWEYPIHHQIIVVGSCHSVHQGLSEPMIAIHGYSNTISCPSHNCWRTTSGYAAKGE